MVHRCLLVLLLFCAGLKARAQDPCQSVSPITCGRAFAFATSGPGNASYPNGAGQGTSCANFIATGGGEQIYGFRAPTTGSYNLSLLSESQSGAIEFFWKDAARGCGPSGWNCLGYNGAAGPINSLFMAAGDSILLLANAENVGSLSVTFRLDCGVNLCENITGIACGSDLVFATPNAYGDPRYVNGFAAACRQAFGVGGGERMYKLKAPTTGSYQIRAKTATQTGQAVEYFWKDAALGCGTSGWSCLGYTASPGSLGSLYMASGDSILLLLNAETSRAEQVTFRVECGVNVCDGIDTLFCGNLASFSTPGGFGDPRYPNGMGGGLSCAQAFGTGGAEKIYRFKATSTGTYQLSLLSNNAGAVEFYTKPLSQGCAPAGWTCRGYQQNAGPVSAFNLTAGDSLLLLVNAEATMPETIRFQFSCARTVCTSLTDIMPGQTVTFLSTGGYGDPNYPNTLVGGCNRAAGQGGPEQVYRMSVPTSGSYTVQTLTSPDNNYRQFYYKLDDGAGPCSGPWTCIGNANSPRTLPGFSLTAGTQVYLLVNAESTDALSLDFRVNGPAGPLAPPSVQGDTVCGTQAANLSAFSAEPGITYRWYTVATGGQPIAGARSGTYSPTVSQTTTFYVSVTNGAIESTRVPVTVFFVGQPSMPILNEVGRQVYCAGSPAVLSIQNPDPDIIYLWSNGARGPSISVSSSGTYSVEAVDRGCLSGPSFGVTVSTLEAPAISGSDTAYKCPNQTIELWVDASEPTFSYEWTSSTMASVPGSSIVTIDPGIFRVRAIVRTCTSAFSAPVYVKDRSTMPPTIAGPGTQGFCPGRVLSLTVLNPEPSSQYTWSNGSQGSSITVSTPGTYSVAVSRQGCASGLSVPVTVQAFPAPVVRVGFPALPICRGQSLTLTATGALTYQWDAPVQNGQPFEPQASGWYRVTGTDANQCQARDSVYLRLTSVPLQVPPDTSLCAGSSLRLVAQGPAVAWSGGIQNGVPFLPQATATYTVTAQDSGCTTQDSVRVTVVLPPSAPVITQRNDTLFADGGIVTWYRDGAPVGTPGPWLRLDATLGGTYTAIRSRAACSSPPSNGIQVTPSALQPGRAGSVRLFPNPAGSYLCIESQEPIRRFTLVTALGTELELSLTGSRADLSGLPPGLYQAWVETPAGRSSHRIVKR